MSLGVGTVGTPNGVGCSMTKDNIALTLRDHINMELLRQSNHGGSSIRLVGMGISRVPETDIKLLEMVERLSMKKNWISFLPENFNSLRNLRYLDLDSNILQEIPIVLMQCPTLEILDLSNNKIKSLPQDITKLWADNLKVLSLKNNSVRSIWDMTSLTQLKNLSVLEIEGNPLPKEELDLVRSYTPMNSNISGEEYWSLALRRYLQNHVAPLVLGGNHINNESANNSSHNGARNTENSSSNNNDINNISVDPKVSRAVKRMGFISTSTSLDHSISASSPVLQAFPTENESFLSSQNDANMVTSNNTELYNHSKFNDYFKRLSILPEEAHQTTDSEGVSSRNENEQHKLPHDELIIACRKLLFSFTECQQNIRKIASFCKEKSVAVSVVSLLYSVRSYIDNLVEVLEQAESKENSHDRVLIKICITIVGIFKQIISQLRKNFAAFFEADDVCFIRMFYMTLICSYNEIYNAWCFIDAEDARLAKKRLVGRSLSSSVAHTVTGANGPGANGIFLPRARSNTLQSKVTPISFNNGNNNNTDLPHLNSKIGTPVSGRVTPPFVLNSQQNNQLASQSANNNYIINNTSINTISAQTNSQVPRESCRDHSPRQQILNSPKQKSTENINESELESSGASIPSSTKNGNVDQQLYQTLRVVIQMVNVVYDQLTSIISKAAHAATVGQQELTGCLLSKIKDLTDTCRHAMDLSKILGERLNLLTSEMVASEKFLTHTEKLKTWENINTFLKSIISILANIKVLMEDMPALNEIRPNLASLAKVTKDVTVVLEVSSYKGVSTLLPQSQQQSQQQLQQQSQHQHHQYQHQHQQQYPYHQQLAPHQHGYQDIHLHPQPHSYEDHLHIPMMTPQANSLKSPFEEV